jgi:hypothetical protein
MKGQYDISFVTVNYNGLQDTMELLESIGRYRDERYTYEIIVVDNGSLNDNISDLEKSFPEAIFIKSSENLGFAGGNNLGIKKATGRYIMLINNDALFSDNSVYNIIGFMDEKPAAGAVSPKIFYSGQGNIIQYAGYTDLSAITLRNITIGQGECDTGQYDSPAITGFCHGAAMVVRREAIEKAGLLPEMFFLYYEEIDWCYSIRNAGYELWYYPYCSVIHKESRNQCGYSPLKRFYITRNRLLLAGRNRRGITKIISILYLVFVAYLKDTVIFIARGNFSQAGAVMKGVFTYFKMKQ